MERTPDGHHVVIDGRRWRAEDPHLPPDVAATLRSQLASARRAVRAATNDEEEKAARARVQRAKVGLGERGTPWWEQTADERKARWEAAIEDTGPGLRRQPRAGGSRSSPPEGP